VRYRFYKHFGSDGVRAEPFRLGDGDQPPPRAYAIVDAGLKAHRGSIIGMTIGPSVIFSAAARTIRI
jgi:hypothetical protein